jgi:hypothetical protein
VDYAAVVRAIAAAGMVARGGFHPAAEDGVPDLVTGQPARTVILAGDVGGRMWPAFAAARDSLPGADPLDAWTRSVLTDVAGRCRAVALFPFGGPPYLPFQRWAQRAEPVAPSPIGILIHPDWGLWHAYRGALAFAEAMVLPSPDRRPSPCLTCLDKPCLATCPVDAFGPSGYDVARCVGHAGGPAGTACAQRGCLARHACPVGAEHRQGAAQAAFHMAAFLAAHRRPH